jgi:hypothetical protein
MGRGRAKAKQTKVARQLKYNSGGTDLDRLRAELIGSQADRDEDRYPPDDDYSDAYAAWVDESDDESDDEDDN